MNNKYCTWCGALLRGDATVCPYCGNAQIPLDSYQGQQPEYQGQQQKTQAVQVDSDYSWAAAPSRFNVQGQAAQTNYDSAGQYVPQNYSAPRYDNYQNQPYQSSYEQYQGNQYTNNPKESNQYFGNEQVHQGNFSYGTNADDESVTTREYDINSIYNDIVYDENLNKPAAIQSITLRRVATGEEYRIFLPVTIGKGSAADVHIVGNPTISRVHARILQQDGRYYIEDLRSSNGTFVNGLRILSNHPTIINPGEIFCLSDDKFILEA